MYSLVHILPAAILKERTTLKSFVTEAVISKIVINSYGQIMLHLDKL
jgi:hypothetical protein